MIIKLSLAVSVTLVTSTVNAGNPIVPDVGMADPHIRIFGNRAYLYTTRDSDRRAKKFTMPDWHIWSSEDLVDWKHEATIRPTETYMGKSTRCWATDCVEKDGKYYFYFSNGNVDTGVMIGKTPIGPFEDALGEPLLSADLMKTKEYDPSVLIDDDGTAYIIFGHHREASEDHFYAIARMNEDMISLAEFPKQVKLTGTVNILKGNDKPTLHKRNGIYYLSAGSHYATSRDIYGPYRKDGNSGNNDFGLTSRAHGNYFEWRNQTFHTWCYFHLGKETARYRESYITYLHYRDDGQMVDDIGFLHDHFATGVGQYDADWDWIEAEWYMASQSCRKKELGDDGFQVVLETPYAILQYPNIQNFPEKASLTLRVATVTGGSLIVQENTDNGRVLGSCTIAPTSGNDHFRDLTFSLEKSETASGLCFVFQGADEREAICLDRFKINKEE